MILHENRLPAEDAREISCLICYFRKSVKIFNCRLLQVKGGTLRVNRSKQKLLKGDNLPYPPFLALQTHLQQETTPRAQSTSAAWHGLEGQAVDTNKRTLFPWLTLSQNLL